MLDLTAVGQSTAAGRARKRYRLLALASSSSFIAKTVTLATSLITVPWTVHYLGAERYGLWMTCNSVIGMLAYSDLGIGNGVLNSICDADGKNDREGARQDVSSAFFLLLGIACSVVLAFGLVYPLVPWARVFNVVSDSAGREAGPLIAVLVVCCAANIPLGLVQRVQLGYQQGFQSNLWLALGNALGLGAIGMAIYFRLGLPGMALATAGAPTVVAGVNWVLEFRTRRPWLWPTLAKFDRLRARSLASTGIVFFTLQVFSLIGNASDNLVIAHVVGTGAIASYAITQRVFSALLIAQFFTVALWPAFGEAIARGDYVWVRQALKRSLILASLLAVGPAVFMVVFGRQLIAAWVGADLAPSYWVLAGFGVWLSIAGYGGCLAAFLNHGTLLRRQMIFHGSASVVALVLKIVFAQFWGSSGVIWGTVLAYGLFSLVPLTILAFRNLPHAEHVRASGHPLHRADSVTL